MHLTSNNGDVSERRGANRYPLRLDVVFSWRDENDQYRGSAGRSRDISLGGIYVQSEVFPAEGASIEMRIFLPRFLNSQRSSEFHAKGKVVRVERDLSSDEQVGGFATVNHSIFLREACRMESEAEDPTRDTLVRDGSDTQG